MKYNFRYGKKRFSTNVVRVNFFRRGIGLMFRTRKTSNLVFEFSRQGLIGRLLTGFCVFFPFLVIWLDNNKRVVDFRFVKPFEMGFTSRKPFSYILEFPINAQNRAIIGFFRRKIRNI